jgi:hypothetical protein
MALSRPLELSQIAAAQRLHKRLEQWQLTDHALASLRAQFPGFAPHEVLLKATVINSLYGTNVYAIPRVARHIVEVMAKVKVQSVGPELVEKLAVTLPVGKLKGRRRYSFASKFAHFFVNPERFPIMDKFAKKMLKFHLGKVFVSDPAHPYVAFCKNYELLKKETGFTGSNRTLDHYLWLAGEYLAWRKTQKARINGDARTLFTSRAADVAADLDGLVP